MSLNVDEIINDVEEWPKCPKCEAKGLLFGDQLSCCISCGFGGSLSDVKPTQLLTFARSRMATRRMGQRGVIAMVAENEDADAPRLIQERASQLAQRMVHYPLLVKAQKYIEKHGTFSPLMVINRQPENKIFETFPLNSEEGIQRAKRRAINSDMVSVIWEEPASSSSFRFFREHKGDKSAEDLAADPDRVLVMNTHVYNAPSHIQAIHFKKVDNTIVWTNPLLPFNDLRVNSLIWQPMDWSGIINRPGSVIPRYLGVAEIENDFSVTLSVCDNMDGAPIVRGVVRAPWEPNKDPVIKDYNVATAEEGIELLKAKYQNVLAKSREPGVGKLLFSQELQWELDVNPHIITYQIRMADFWKTYESIRETK